MPFKLYKSYNFRDKDPVIDKLRTIVQDSGVSYYDINKLSGVSVSCIKGWFEGKTQRPQHASLMAVARALEYELRFVPRQRVVAARKKRHEHIPNG